MERLDGPILTLPSSVGYLSPDEAGSRRFSELAWISRYLDYGEQKVRKSKNKYWC